MIVALAGFLLFLIAYYIFWRKRWMSVFERNGMKGPKPHLIYGNLAELKGGGVVNTIKCVGKWLEEYGPIFGFFRGGRPTLVIADPVLLKQVFIKDFKIFHDRNSPKEFSTHTNPKVANSNLIRRTGSDWKELRTLLRPAFSAVKLKGSIPEMSDAIEALMDNAAKDGKNGEHDLDIYPLYQGMTLDVIGRTAFGVRTNVQRNPDDAFLKAVSEIFKNLGRSVFDKVLTLFPEFSIIIYRIRITLLKIKAFLHGTPYQYVFDMSAHVINERRSNKEHKRNDLLQSMIDGRITASMANEVDYNALSISSDLKENETVMESKTGRQLTDYEIISNTILFFEAGYETTSTALAFVTHILVNHKDVQEKCRQEVLELMSKEGKLDYNSVSQLPFMEAVIYETLRIYPPVVFFVSRVAEADYKYENITIPKGMPVVTPVYHIQHNPQFWPDPEKFDASRFYGENRSNGSSIFWQPFGVGPRNCIGMRFAILEMKLALAMILLKYRIEPGPRTEIGHLSVSSSSVTYKPEHVYARFVPVE